VREALPARATSAGTSWSHSAADSAAHGSGLGQVRGGGPVRCADELEQQLGVQHLHRVGDRHPAADSRTSAPNSALARWPTMACRPNVLRLAIARPPRDRLVRRPSRQPLSRWNIRCSAVRYCLAASRQDRPAGLAAPEQEDVGFLADLQMPSSVSTAARSVTSQSGWDSRHRWVGIDWSRWTSERPRAGRRQRDRLVVVETPLIAGPLGPRALSS